jgi:hypothetical protein
MEEGTRGFISMEVSLKTFMDQIISLILEVLLYHSKNEMTFKIII